MPVLVNREENLSMEINLIRNSMLEVGDDIPETESWIPFELRLKTGAEEYCYTPEHKAAFTLWETRKLIGGFEAAVREKRSGVELTEFEHTCFEVYFEIKLYDTLEENEIYIDLWLNMGSLTKGRIYGFNRGFRFVVCAEALSAFTEELRQQLEALLI